MPQDVRGGEEEVDEYLTVETVYSLRFPSSPLLRGHTLPTCPQDRTWQPFQKQTHILGRLKWKPAVSRRLP